jgi:two-component system phosphate regulon sensor histidine kinase PhoR
MRRDFIANVSHELRTPLTVILGFLDPLAHDKDLPDESRAHFWKMIQDQAERMRRLVEDLLTLSRLEAQSELQQEDVVAVPVLLATLIEEGQTLSCGRHRFESEIAAGNLTGSVSELRSAFGNLISNAVRYTPEGGCIKVRWVLEGEGVLFEVSDTGPGIAAEHIPRLTERFYRVDKGRSTQTGGTGLGLSIVKYVLLHHQARLEIQSELGQGSRFRAWFPRARWVV